MAAAALTFPDRTQRADLSYLEKATAVRIRLGSLRMNKRLPQGTVKTEAGIDETTGETTTTDPDRIGASKKLLQCKEAAAIVTEQRRLKTWIISRTVPTPFGTGTYFVPNTLLGEVDAELVVSQSNIKRLGEEFIGAYDAVLEGDRKALGPQFCAADYDTPGEIRERLSLDWDYVVFGVPQNLPGNLYMRETGKAQQKLGEVVDTIQQVLRAEMADLVAYAACALTSTKENGKARTFKNTTTENIREFLSVFTARNITNDTQLEALCNQARALLDGVKPQDLRDSESLRKTVALGFTDIRAKLDTMLVPTGTRKITFADAGADE